MVKKYRAIFLDRDGTILNERGYLGDPSKMVFYPTAFRGMKTLQRLGFKLIVVSNQSGVGRGFFSLADLEKVNAAFRHRLSQQGVRLRKIYFCPHRPEAGCSCRKPKPGLPRRAARECQVDLRTSYVIGDQDRDMLLAERIGATGILVLTGAGKYYRSRMKNRVSKVAANLETASRWILQRETKGAWKNR